MYNYKIYAVITALVVRLIIWLKSPVYITITGLQIFVNYSGLLTVFYESMSMKVWWVLDYYTSITCCANLKLLNTPTKPDMTVSLILHVYRVYIWYLFQQQKVRIKFQLSEIWANHAKRIKLHKNGPATCLLLSIQEPEFAMPTVIWCSFPP